MELIQYNSGTEDFVVAKCVEALRTPGGVVLLPTETVYGLVCRWCDAAARERIYALKRRDKSKLLSMFAPDMEAARAAGAVITPLARELFRKFTPGGVTIICPAADGGTVGVRVPDHPLVLKILAALGEPLASTSANLSGTPAATSAGMGLATLDGEPTLAVSGEALPENALASTVVDATGARPLILREGAVKKAEILALQPSGSP